MSAKFAAICSSPRRPADIGGLATGLIVVSLSLTRVHFIAGRHRWTGRGALSSICFFTAS